MTKLSDDVLEILMKWSDNLKEHPRLRLPVFLLVGLVVMAISVTAFFVLINPVGVEPLRGKLGLFIVICVLIFMAAFEFEDLFSYLFGTVLFLIFFAGAFYALGALIHALIYSEVTIWYGRATWSSILFGCAISLTWLKRRSLKHYAYLEISYSFLATWLALSNFASSSKPTTLSSLDPWFAIQITTIAASLYLMVKGMDDWVTARKLTNVAQAAAA